MEIEIAKEKETGELMGVRTLKGISSLAFALLFLLSLHLSSSVINLMASTKFGVSSLSKGISPRQFGSMSSRISGAGEGWMSWTELQVAGACGYLKVSFELVILL